MNGVPYSDFGDYTNHCLAHFKNRPAFKAAFEKQNYVVADEWFGTNKYEVQGGNQIEARVVLGHNGSARMVRPMQVTPRNHTDNFKKYTSPWVTARGEVNYDEEVASDFTADTELADYMKGQFFVGVQSNIDLLDQQGFAVPNDSSDDLNARGVAYWVNFADTGTTDFTGGFNGKTAIYGDASTTTSIGGIDKSTEPLWRNWTCNFSGTVDMALCDAIERGLLFTDFKPPKDIKGYASEDRPKRRIYSGLTHFAQYNRLRNSGNDDRNGDVRPFSILQGSKFSGVEWVPVAELENKAHSPVYVLDMPNFYPFVKRGWFLRKTKAMNDVDQPNFYTVYLYTKFNFGCDMPRKQAVYHTTF